MGVFPCKTHCGHIDLGDGFLNYGAWPGHVVGGRCAPLRKKLAKVPKGFYTLLLANLFPVKQFIFCVCSSQLIGLREKLQENPIFHGKNLWFPVDYPLSPTH